MLEQIGGYVVDSNELEIRAVAGIYVTGFSPQTMYMIDEVEEIPYSEEEISRIPSITGYIVKKRRHSLEYRKTLRNDNRKNEAI